MDDTGEGIPLFKFVPAEALGKQGPDIGNPRGSSGQKDRIHLRRQQAGRCDNAIDAGGNLQEIIRIERFKFCLADLLVDAQIAVLEMDPGPVQPGKLALGLFDSLKQEKAVIIVDDVLQVFDGPAIVGGRP